MLILLTNDILVIMPIPSVRMNLVDNPSPPHYTNILIFILL